MVQLLDLLKKEDTTNGSYTYLSTHPATRERMTDVENYINNNNIRIIQKRQRNDSWKELKKTFK